MKDDFRLIADTAINALGIKAHRVEEAITTLSPSKEKTALLKIVQDMRKREMSLRHRIIALDPALTERKAVDHGTS